MDIYKLIILFSFKIAFCWDLSSLNINNDYFVNSVALHRTRVFLALPRSACSNNESDPTLVEAHWNGDISTSFSTNRATIIASQIWNDCESIQDAVALQMEPIKPKLWILDKGNEKCPPKISSFSLVFNNIAESITLTNIEQNNLNSLVIDPVLESDFGHRAYIGHIDDNVLLVISLKKLIWWKVFLSVPSIFSSPVKGDYLAFSKVSSELFLTGKNSLDVFSLDLGPLRQMEDPLALETESLLFNFNVTNRGQKLGVSTGIALDNDAGLIYYMTQDYAILRWDTRYPLEAEYHYVLSQSYHSFPYIAGFFEDSQNAIWALVNPTSSDRCSNEDGLLVKTRAVRILKYNMLTRDIEFENFEAENDPYMGIVDEREYKDEKEDKYERLDQENNEEISVESEYENKESEIQKYFSENETEVTVNENNYNEKVDNDYIVETEQNSKENITRKEDQSGLETSKKSKEENIDLYLNNMNENIDENISYKYEGTEKLGEAESTTELIKTEENIENNATSSTSSDLDIIKQEIGEKNTVNLQQRIMSDIQSTENVDDDLLSKLDLSDNSENYEFDSEEEDALEEDEVNLPEESEIIGETLKLNTLEVDEGKESVYKKKDSKHSGMEIEEMENDELETNEETNVEEDDETEEKVLVFETTTEKITQLSKEKSYDTVSESDSDFTSKYDDYEFDTDSE